MNPFCSMIGLARRAGKLVTGHDAVCRALEKGTIPRIYLASDLSEKTAKKVIAFCEQLQKEAVTAPFTIDEAEQYTHKAVGVIGVTDPNMDRQLSALAKRPQRTETEE